MKSKLSKLHNYFVNENPITKMMFDEFPNDFVLYGGCLVDYLIDNEHIIDYDCAMLNSKWEDAEKFLLSNQPNKNRWQYKKLIVPGRSYWETYDKQTGEPKYVDGHLSHVVCLEPINNYEVELNIANQKWEKKYLAITKINTTDPYYLIDSTDSIQNRIAITKTDVLMRDERPLECIKWRTIEYDGWCINPIRSMGRCSRYNQGKGFHYDEKLRNAFQKLDLYRGEYKDGIDGIGDGNQVHAEIESNDIFHYLSNNLEIPKRYKIDYHYNDSGMIKEI